MRQASARLSLPLSGLCATLALLALGPAPAAGQELVAGWEGEAERGYAFVAPTVLLPADGSSSLLLRVAASYLYYEFPAGDDVTEVRSPGLAAAVGYRVQKPRLSLTLATGIEFRQSLRQSSSHREDVSERGGTAQVELFANLRPTTQGAVIASYGHANRYIWMRAALREQFTNRSLQSAIALSGAVEATRHGNDDVSVTQIGGAFECLFVRRALSLQGRAGVSIDHTADTRRPYVGIGLYRRF